MNAVLYSRVSSKEQESEGFSLDAQVKVARDYASRNKLEIIRTWKVSESAWSAGRKEFGQMVEFLKRRSDVPHIIFDCPDRMTRNDFDKVKIWALVKDFEKTIHFARTGKVIDRRSGSDDEFMFDIEVAVAKKMSNDISKKASMGMQEKAEQGFYPGKAPLGYNNNLQSKTIELDTVRAPLVKRAFELMASGQYTLSGIVTKMQELGLRSLKDHDVKKSALFPILNNPFYYGAFTWKERLFSGNHEALVSKNLWDKSRDAMTGRGHSMKFRSNGFLFNSLATCGLCGCRIVGEKKKSKYLYYHCTFSKGRHEGVPYLSEKRYCSLFESTVKRITISSEWRDFLSELLHDYQQQSTETVERSIKSSSARRDVLKRRIDTLYDSYCDGVIDRASFVRKEKDYKSELIDIDDRLVKGEENSESVVQTGQKIFELLNRLHPTYLEMNPENRVRMLKILSSNYTLHGSTICPTYSQPFNWFVDLPPRPTKLPRLDSN